MKNLFGAVAPTNRVLGSFKVLMLILLVTIGFTSCKDQSKSEVSSESELISKSGFQGTESIMDIGGNQVPPGGFCEQRSNQKGHEFSTIGGGKDDIGDYTIFNIGGGKDPIGGPGKHDILSSNTIEISRKSILREYTISAIGGRGGVDPPGGIDSRFHRNDKNNDYESC